MSTATKIQWTDATWNPVRGCSRISPGCEHCYAETMASRFTKPGQAFHGFAADGRWTRKVALVPDMLGLPLRWKGPRRIFVNSMSDLFHEGLSPLDIGRVFEVMEKCPQHTFQVLTKRADVMQRWMATEYATEPPPANVWLGVSVEDQKRADERIPELLKVPAAARFLSAEPLLGPVDLSKYLGRRCLMCNGSASVPAPGGGKACPRCFDVGQFIDPDQIDWVIVGGESGHGARAMDLAWARTVVEQCKATGTSVFVKQLGERPNGEAVSVVRGRTIIDGRWMKDRKGGEPDEWPADLRIREFPRGAP